MKTIQITLLAICLFFVSALVAKIVDKKNPVTFSPNQQIQIEKIVHQYLLDHPEVLVEASQALQKKEMQEMQQTAIDATKRHIPELLNAPESPVVGNMDGKITLIAFLDYQCSHCRAMTDIIESLLRHNSNLRVIFKEFPIFGPDSANAAHAALAANLQGKYFDLHQAFMKSEIPFSQDNILKMAAKVGIDTKRLSKDMKSEAISQELKQNFKLAKVLMLVGTPAFIVTATHLDKNSDLPIGFFPGQVPEEQLQQMIDTLQSKLS